MKMIEKGTEIICPNCEKVMMTASKDIMSGDVISIDNFDQVNFKGVKGDHTRCPDCDVSFGAVRTVNQLYTKDGWV